MQIATKFLGLKEIDEEKIITFKEGLLGFPDDKRFVLFPQPKTPFLFLQSIEKPDLCFILVNPYVIKPDYLPEFSAEILDELGIKEQKPAVYTLVVIPDDINKMRTNLQAPVVINVEQRKARQVVLNHDYPIQYHLPAQPLKEGA